ncbi:hypothetical protein SAMN05444340_11730 [Citreimonas salinaria]|uniref:Uncharacterized protein n=2 Tax=Citreimonas salinaria TaxID=321339 RepID=A0A1H3MIB6_9RHOB|nr:hypothetical protein SAMN05444340_11730 [Citreimonas salinaria]
MPQRMHQLHGEAYLFDTIIQNWDRRIANPNMLKKGDEFRLIDHEEAFVSATGADEDRDVVRKPWEAFGIDNFIAGDMQHPFWRRLKPSNHVDFGRAADAWKSLPDDTFSLYAAEASGDWGRATCDSIAAYLDDARRNIEAVVDAIQRAREQ